ncbi:MAG: hypothetical protein O2871_01440 [bacterium]|nr:hypothetical protein [bacterium]
MTEKTLNNKIQYELTEAECKNLLKLAKEAMSKTYPIANQGYAVALLTKSGNTYTGV